MARTFVPDYTKRKLSPISKGTLRGHMQQQLQISQGDSDKGDTIENVCFYDGQVSILTWALELLTIKPKDKD